MCLNGYNNRHYYLHQVSHSQSRGEGKGLVKLNRHFCSHYAMKIVADMRSSTSSCPGSECNSSHCITTVAIISSNYITARALLEAADRCRTTSSIEFHRTLSFPSSGWCRVWLRETRWGTIFSTFCSIFY